MAQLKNRYFIAIISTGLLMQLGCSASEKSNAAGNSQRTDDVSAKDTSSAEKFADIAAPEKKAPEPAAEQTVYQILKPKDEVVSFLTASDIDKVDIGNCMFNFSGHPFDLTSGTLSFRRIEFDKITGTLAIALTDDKPTDQPQIVLIRALETIGSELIFNLKNPKAYYCFKNIDDLGTDYEIHLNCEAQVSESLRWTDDKYKTALSVAVEDSGVYLSPNKTKKLIHERPAGATCLSGR